jgi:hypothetical protein
VKKSDAQIGREVDALLEATRARDISDRRIAALRANREDVRNSSAWRDAMYERRQIDFFERSRRPPRKQPARELGTKVTIRWFAIPNVDTRRGGFMPMVEVDGKLKGDTYGTGYARDIAESMAEERARALADRYVGDWRVTVRKGEGRYVAAALKRDERRWSKARRG